MAAKRKIAKPKPSFDRPWAQLTKAQQSSLYVKALTDFYAGKGPNPGTSGAFDRAKAG